MHLYFRCPPERLPPQQAIVLRQSDTMIVNKPAWTIDLLSGKHAVTLPPSIHPSGEPYEWINGGLEHVEELPESLLTDVAKALEKQAAPALRQEIDWPTPISAELKPVPRFGADILSRTRCADG